MMLRETLDLDMINEIIRILRDRDGLEIMETSGMNLSNCLS